MYLHRKIYSSYPPRKQLSDIVQKFIASLYYHVYAITTSTIMKLNIVTIHTQPLSMLEYILQIYLST